MLDKLKTKTLWVGLVGAAALVADTFFGVQIGSDLVDKLADGVATLMVVYGIFTDHN